VGDDEAAWANKRRDLMQRVRRIGLMDEETAAEGEVKWSGHGCHVEIIHISVDHFDVVEPECGHIRLRAGDSRLDEVNADDASARPDDFRKNGESADWSAAALDGTPAFGDADPPEGIARKRSGYLRDAKQTL
jgi:hypothetical protein